MSSAAHKGSWHTYARPAVLTHIAHYVPTKLCPALTTGFFSCALVYPFLRWSWHASPRCNGQNSLAFHQHGSPSHFQRCGGLHPSQSTPVLYRALSLANVFVATTSVF
eukprot:71784-Amphidinium_carterae.1